MRRSVVFSSALIIFLCNSTAHSQVQPQVGYGVIEPAQPATTFGAALITLWSERGVLLSETAFGAASPTSRGCFFVSEENGSRTSVALVNLSLAPSNVVLTLKDAAGLQVAQRNDVFGPGEQHALYIDELFPSVLGFFGSMTFQSDNPEGLAVIAFRWTGNAFGEPVFSSVPVIDLNQAAVTPVLLPQVAAGDDLSTVILLLNPTPQRATGSIRLRTDNGAPLELTLNGSPATEFTYDISPGGLLRAQLTQAGPILAGFAEIVTTGGSAVVSAQTVFQYTSGVGLYSESAMIARPATDAARVFVEQSTAHTGVAVANPYASPASLTLILKDLDGTLLNSITRGLPGNGHTSFFVDEAFPALPRTFTGLMEIAATQPVALSASRVTTSARNLTVLSAMPVMDMTRPPPAGKLVLPQITFGSFGQEFLTSRTILLNQDTRAADGHLRLFASDGLPLSQPLGCSTPDFAYALSPGGASADLRPCWPRQLTATRDSPNPVLSSGTGGVPISTLDPFVVEDVEGYHLFFTSIFCRKGNDYSISFDPGNPSNCSLFDTIGATAYAFSPDKGFTWQLRDRPVLYPGATGWDNRKIETPNVVRVGNRLFLFYCADAVGFEQRFQIGATAVDLIGGSIKDTFLQSDTTFPRSSLPLIAFETTTRSFINNVQEPAVVFRNGLFEVYFTGVEWELPDKPEQASGQAIRFVGLGRRVFDSQLNVVERDDTPLLDWVNMPELKIVNDSYFLFSTTLAPGEFHHDEEIVFRTSTNGLKWSNPVPLLSKGPVSAFDDWGVTAAAAVPGVDSFTMFYMAFGVQNSPCSLGYPGGRVGTPIENGQRCVFSSIGRATGKFPGTIP